MAASAPVAGGREAAARRAAEHRAARRARAGARGQLHRRSRSRAAAPATSFRGSRTTPACCAHAYRTLADDVRTGQFVAAGGRMAARQLPPGHLRDPRHPPQPAARLLPRSCRRSPRASTPATRASTRWPSSWSATATAASIASSSIAVPEQLPARRAADDRRAVGVAEHAEAGAHREPAPPGRGDCCRARRAPLAADALRVDEPTRPARDAAAAAGTRHRVRRPAAAPRPRVRPPAVGDPRRRRRRTSRRSRRPPRTTIRGEHQRQARRAGLGGQRHHQPAPVLDARLAASTSSRSAWSSSVLQRDPAGAYGAMDFLSRDRAAPGGRGAGGAERRGAGARGAARRSRAPARRPPSGSTADRAAHVGYHLVDRGRARSRSRPRLSARRRDARCGALLLRARDARLPRRDRDRDRAAARRRGRPTRGTPAARPAVQFWSRCSLLLPASDLAIALRPARRRRASSRPGGCRASTSPSGVPDSARTMVIVPTMLTSVDGRRRAARAPRGAGARQPRPVHPLRDPQRLRRRRRARDAPDDAAILAARARGHRGAQRQVRRRARRPLLPVPSRPAVERAASSAWIGWERKRGKIEEFNRLLRGATDTSFSTQVGELDVLPSVRYCITLDSDTRLPRDAAQAADRHHRAPAEPAAVRPARRARHRRLRHPAAARQRDDGERGGIAVRAHLRRPHRRRPVHDRRLGRLPGSLRRRDLHRQGALRRRRVRRGARGPRAGERAAVARPVRGALRAHGAGHRRRGRRRLSRRACSRTPGGSTAGCAATGRSCWWLFPFVPSRAGLRAQPPAAHLALEDPRQPAAQPACRRPRCCCSCSAGPSCRAMPLVVDRASALAALAFPGVSRAARGAARSAPRRSRGASSCARRSRICKTAARAVRAAARLHGERGERAAARDRRSRWSASASPAGACWSGRRRPPAPPAAARCSWRAFLRGMVASPLLALATLLVVVLVRPAALPIALPVLALWVAAPWIAYALSRPTTSQRR